MDARVSKEWENPFSVTATMGEILEVQPSGGGGEREPEKVFVAVPEQYKHGKSVLAWALRHAAAVVVVLMHIHVPAQMIPMSTYSHRHTTSLRSRRVILCSRRRRSPFDRPRAALIERRGASGMFAFGDPCISIFASLAFLAHRRNPTKCTAAIVAVAARLARQGKRIRALHMQLKVKCEKLVIENAHIAKGITELVSMHGVTKLVMGAAADKNYSRKMKMPKSKTALAVLQRADISCKIWFVCKEHLIYTREEVSREVGDLISLDIPTPPASRSSISPLSEWDAPSRQCPSNAIDGQIQRSMSVSGKAVPKSVRTTFRLPSRSTARTTLSRLVLEDNSAHSWDSIPRESFPGSQQTSSTVTDEGFSDSSSFSIPRDDVSEILHPVRAGCDLLNPVSYHEQGAIDPNTDLFDKLEETFTESDKFQRKAFDESLRRQKGEEELTLFKKVNQKKEVETALAKANEDIEVMKQEMDALKQDRDDIIDKFIQMSEQKAMLEKRVNEYDGTVKDLKDVVAANRSLIGSQQAEYEQMKHERDTALKDADELRKEKDKALSCSNLWNTEFSLSELKQATQDFCDTMKVGEGGFGRVYKGHLRNTTVAIKMLRSHNVQGQSQFQQEVVVLSKVRHPNLVTLIGTCSEASGLVYEFLPNGSLEDRLACANNTPPLAWQVRTRIIGEICAALIFLHSNKPHPVIHGDLKPANILLDANLVSKLCDFGISCLLNKSSTMSTSLYQTTNPRGTFAYMDPEFLTTGELTARSDIYSFGILILQLVTGKPALGIGRAVEDALDKDELELLVDKSAGRWPFDQAKKLMLLGLHCVELSRRRRPDRMSDVWCVVEPLVKSALSVAPPSFGHR
ncbi:hypothetical protein PR202_ga07758 [Eleusine coracana subsp. coracana]|uniref:RING-type E3 ubiquitin transferase n=1 Tax=Eleusine coracana subsp. coracana TaxID=191504 RepID=A0AAV5BYC4_ELECO|nr:hypothetical protein PR202_ga07758 [Eleusine coracana subsp. coracana]